MNKTVDDHSAERERVEVGAGGCGCPITGEMYVVNGELRGDVEDTDRTEHRAGCWDDRRIVEVDEARIAALREHAHRYPYEVVGLPAPYQHMTGVEIEAGFAAYEALPAADDGPGRDQHGPHERPGAVPFDEFLLRAADEAAAEMTGPAVSVEHDAARQGDADLETRVRNTIYDREQGIVSRRLAARQIIRVVRDFDQRASHEGATVSDADGGCE